MGHLTFLLGVMWGKGSLPGFHPVLLQFLVRFDLVDPFGCPSTPTVVTASSARTKVATHQGQNPDCGDTGNAVIHL